MNNNQKFKREQTFESADKVTILHSTVWEPAGEAIAVLVISHGIGEHIGRYERLANFLNDRGIIVAGIDDIGHGRSASNLNLPMYFGEKGSWRYVVKDFINFTNAMSARYALPCFVMGFSMGSFVVRTALAEDTMFKISGAILAGTGSISPLISKMVQKLVDSEAKKVGGDYIVSQKVNDLAFGNYNRFFKPTKTDYDWLCASENGLRDYMKDSLVNRFITPGMFRELLSGMAYTSKASTIRKSRKIPMIFLSGKDDPVGSFGKSVKKVANKYNVAGADTEVVLYDRCRHDIWHDNCRNSAQRDLYDWMTDYLN